MKPQNKAQKNETNDDGLIKPGHHGSLFEYMGKNMGKKRISLPSAQT